MKNRRWVCACVGIAACVCGAVSAAEAERRADRYLDMMETAVGAYSRERIDEYIARVERELISEHGFPRLTANIGILLAHGRVPHLKERFATMMNICCTQMSVARFRHGKSAGNDFSVKEIVIALLEVEKAGLFPKRLIAAWRAGLSLIVPEQTYSVIAKPGTTVANWAVFGAASEQMRIFAGLNGDPAFVERQISDQLKHFDENGMYRDPQEPAVYDFVTRLQFAVALEYGYDGPSRPALEALMAKSAEPTLLMQSRTGQIPYGGRSNQFLHNDTFYAALCEYYARWCMRRGDVARAARFRAAADRAIESFAGWTKRPDFKHVKNRFPLESRFGCENYGYFNKYMVTAGSWAMIARLFVTDEIPAAPRETAPRAWRTSEAFHWAFLSAGDYTAQFDLAANPAYDGSGLGRFERRGLPTPLCLSVPFARKPHYEIGGTNATPLAILPGCLRDGAWRYAYGNGYRLAELTQDNVAARATFAVTCDAPAGAATHADEPLAWKCAVSADGMTMTLNGRGDGLALTVPVFLTDGETASTVTAGASELTVRFHNGICRYTTNGAFVDTGILYTNRNGRYRRYEARGKDGLSLRIRLDATE